jgi:hypothetical protein
MKTLKGYLLRTAARFHTKPGYYEGSPLEIKPTQRYLGGL